MIRALHSRIVRVMLTGAFSGMTLVAATPADAAGPIVNMTEGNAKDEKTWKFTPPDINVKVGTTVAWTNQGKQPHTASANDGSFDSGTMTSGARWEHRFDSPGDFAYLCTFHPQMTGIVHVKP